MRESIWRSQPMARIALLSCLGCIIGRSISNEGFAILLISISLFVVFLLLLLSFKQKQVTKAHSIRYSILISVFFVSSFSSAFYFNNKTEASYLSEYDGDSTIQSFVLQVASEPRLKNNRLSVKCQLIYHINGEILIKCDEAVMLFVENGRSEQYQIGDRKCVMGVIQEPQPNQLPDSFNYKQFLHVQGMNSILSTNSTDVYELKENENSLQRFSFQWRSRLLNRMPKSIIADKERQVASALLMGERTEMQRDIVQLYSAGGIIHILAVSGLHVGLLYQALLFLFGWIKWFKTKNAHLLLIVIILWLYAFMTGLSPSVNRAICMFTLIIVSGLLKRNVSAFNHIGSAAFLLVLIDPHAIFDLGFLLSFSAVLGIIGAKPILDRLSRIKNKVLRLICVPIVISIVAQLATFPITLFSFGTFPLWFLPANFIAVPLSTLLTYIGLSSLVLADIPFIGEGMMHVFSWGIKVLNEWAWFIGQLPYSQLKGLTISMIEFVFISISIYFLFRSFHIQSKRSLLFFCHFLFLTCLTTFMRIEWEASSRKIQLFAFKNQLHIRISKNFNSSHFIIASSAQPIKPIYFPFLQKDEKCDVQFILVGNSRLHSSTTRGIHNSSYHFISKNVCLVFNNLSDNEWKEIERHSQLQLHFIPAPWMYSTEMKAVKKKCKMKDIRCLDLEKQGCINLSY